MSISLVTTSLRPSCLYFLLKTLSTSSIFLQTPHVSKAKEKASLLSFFLSFFSGVRVFAAALGSLQLWRGAALVVELSGSGACSTRHLPGPGTEPESLALVGGFLTPGSPGTSVEGCFLSQPEDPPCLCLCSPPHRVHSEDLSDVE